MLYYIGDESVDLVVGFQNLIPFACFLFSSNNKCAILHATCDLNAFKVVTQTKRYNTMKKLCITGLFKILFCCCCCSCYILILCYSYSYSRHCCNDIVLIQSFVSVSFMRYGFCLIFFKVFVIVVHIVLSIWSCRCMRICKCHHVLLFCVTFVKYGRKMLKKRCRIQEEMKGEEK